MVIQFKKSPCKVRFYITKVDRLHARGIAQKVRKEKDYEAQKPDDLLHRDFQAEAPPEKSVNDITEIKAIIS
jgi:hypothetical protein